MRTLIVGSANLRHIEPYLRHSVRAGWDVYWWVTAPGPVRVDGVTMLDGHGGKPYTSDVGKLDYFRQGLRLRRAVRAIAPDIIHAHYASSAGLMAWLSGYRPYAVTIHGSDLMERSQTWLGRAILGRVLRGAALVNPVAEHMRGLLAQLRVPDERVLPLPFGIDLERFPYRPRADLFRNGVRLVCTRSLRSPVYDIPTILRAVAEARRAGAQVTLSLPAGGEGGEGAAGLKQLAGELGIAGAVQWGTGYRNEEVPAILGAHDAYVSASLRDGASLSLMEAMACGIVPVVSDIPANREWAQDGEGAFLFPCGDWRRLAEIIMSLPGRRDGIPRAVRQNRDVVEGRGDRRKNLEVLMGRLAETARPAGGD
jgi:glycosyltransferase involved in cell wall biosynthesis